MTHNRMLLIHRIVFGLLALVVAFAITRSTAEQPGYTDAFYYYNAAERLVNGEGLTDAYLWTYIGAPDSPDENGDFPSHLYWMPFTSLTAAFGMWVLDAPGDFQAAQWPFALMFAGAAVVAFWLGGYLGGTVRHMWVAGLVMLFSGFFTRFWGMTDSFAPYALFGSLALVFMGLGLSYKSSGKVRFTPTMLVFLFISGVCTGFGHLTRADGLLLLLVAWLFIGWYFLANPRQLRAVALSFAAVTLGYLLVMTPWFLRNIDIIGTPLPIGGTQSIWYSEYNDLFKYGVETTPQDLFADGLSTFFESRWLAFTNNLGTFIAVEGLVTLTPLMLIAEWKRRREGFLQPFLIYALGLHVVMTFVFPFPGFRGGLFHSAAALMPWWAALGVVGLDDTIEWVANRRRRWRPAQAKWVFSLGIVGIAIVLSLSLISGNAVRQSTPRLYTQLSATLPQDTRIMINDPAQLYFHTKMGGVVIPSAEPDATPEIAARYDVDYLLIEIVNGGFATPARFRFDPDNPPEFLTPVDVELPGARLYAIRQNP